MSDDDAGTVTAIAPQVFSTGCSTNPNLVEAVREATNAALASLPPFDGAEDGGIDLAVVVASSLYDEPSRIVPTLLETASSYGGGVKHLVGNTAGGVIGSNSRGGSSSASSRAKKGGNAATAGGECRPQEVEASFAVSVTLALLPDVELRTFHVEAEDVPAFEDVGRIPPSLWKRSVGLGGLGEGEGDEEVDDPVFMVIPSPSFQKDLDDFLRGLQNAFPNSDTFGGIASTVSSLSRARMFKYSALSGTSDKQQIVYGDGCVGVALSGDVTVRTMIAQGAKPVGGVYRVVAAGEGNEDGSRSTIGAIVLDEAATAEENEAYAKEEEDSDDENDDGEEKTKQEKLAIDYAKARIPKPPLAEANFVMKRLSDDDQAFMRRALLIGLERGGSLGRTPSELARLAAGEGYRFTVRQIASAGMKDGSVTFPLGSVNVEVGARCRFFVRDGDFAKRELEALWTGYKKRELEATMGNDSDDGFIPTGCMVFPTLDRGVKLFGGKEGYESDLVSSFLPTVSSVSGFFANGVLGKLDGTLTNGANVGSNENMLHGSSSSHVVFGSKSKRPLYSPARAASEAANEAAAKAKAAAAEKSLAAEDEYVSEKSSSVASEDGRAAPRAENGELVVKRREIHHGRAMSVSSVEWSVAEKTAKPTSVLEGYMWEKETQIDRQRERISLALLLSQCKLAMMDPKNPKPRDWIGPIKQAGADGDFVIIPELKRIEPVTGSLRKRYDLPKIVKQLTNAGAPSISVNSDSVLFGGSMEDITQAREESTAAALSEAADSDDGVVSPPVLASDLLLYPYQLYKFRMAGADAVTIVVGALESKDIVYLTKIASTLQLQVVASVTTEAQIERLTKAVGAGGLSALVLSNRDLEHFDFDESGEQALSLLKSDALKTFREKLDIPIMVDGRVGIIKAEESGSNYIKELKEAGAFGAIVGGGIAFINEEDAAEALIRLAAQAGE